MNREALLLADECQKSAAELRRLHDLLGKANALSRIRAKRIAELEALLGCSECGVRSTPTSTFGLYCVDCAEIFFRSKRGKA
jgi:hypothetical protein